MTETSTEGVALEEVDADLFVVKPKDSRFTVQAFAEGLLSAFGHNPKLTAREIGGEVHFHRNNLEQSSLKFFVKVDSLQVLDDVSGKDRSDIERMMKEEVLETSRFPEIQFHSTSVSANRIYEGFYRVKIDGELTVHGVTRPHSIDSQVRLMADGLRAEGESALRQSEFGIKRISVAGGTLKVKDEVKVSFLIVAGKP